MVPAIINEEVGFSRLDMSPEEDQVTSQKRGLPFPRISNFANRLAAPCAVLGGKNSSE